MSAPTSASNRRAAVIDQLYAAAPALIVAVTDPTVLADAPLKERVAALSAVDKFLYHLEKLQADATPPSSSHRPASDEPFDFEILYPGDPGYDDPDPWVLAADIPTEPPQFSDTAPMPVALPRHDEPSSAQQHDTDDERRAAVKDRRLPVNLAAPPNKNAGASSGHPDVFAVPAG